MGIRKNQTALSIQEKQNFVDALIALKADGTYDRFVQIHVDAMATPTPSNVSTMTRNAAHRGPAFLPWHREFLRRLELELQRIDPSVDLPYWDWTIDNTISASIFSDNFMGGSGNTSNGNIVETGSFGTNAGNWPLSIDGPSLRRTISSSVSLPTTSQVNSCLGVTPYDSSPWDATSDPASSFRNRLEGWRGDGNIHNRAHVWVGGSMTLGSSPNDPLFFMHHCNIDRLWALWQQQHLTECYAPTSGTNTDQNLNDPMFPWMGTITPASVIDISALNYSYDNVPQGPICSGGGSSGGGSSGGGSSGKCFIATAAYGSELEPSVQFLREFRDDVVLQSRFQKPFEKILNGYYKVSPPIADQMREHKTLKYFIKYSVVWPFVASTRTFAFVLDNTVLRNQTHDSENDEDLSSD